MTEVTPIGSRKADHIRINIEKQVTSGLSTGLEKFQFIHRALPEINLEDVDLSINIFGRTLSSPILISSMTGGTDQAISINRTLAMAAQNKKIALGVGSQRAAIDHPHLAESFQIRKYAPDILLFANLGAVQLNYGYTVDHCKKAVEMIHADALVLHFNALQEALQPEGNTEFHGLAKKIESICADLDVPVIAKEVGWGFSEADVKLLKNSGIAAIDVAGAGGTSWSEVESHRAPNEMRKQLAKSFIDWGIPTAQSILNVKKVAPQLEIFASGGLKSGIDIAKCVALGSSLGGMASPFLKTATSSLEETIALIERIHEEIKICMFSTGSAAISDFQENRIIQI